MPLVRGRVLSEFGDALCDQRDFSGAVSVLDEAIDLLENECSDHDPEVVLHARQAVLIRRARSLQLDGALSEAVAGFLRVIALTEQMQRPDELIALYRNLANTYASLGQPEGENRFWAKALRASRRAKNLRERAEITKHVSERLLIERGSLSRASRWANEGLRLAVQLKERKPRALRKPEAQIQDTLGLMFAAEKEFEQAIDAHAACVETKSKLGDRGGVAWARSNQGLACLLNEDENAALWLCQDARDESSGQERKTTMGLCGHGSPCLSCRVGWVMLPGLAPRSTRWRFSWDGSGSRSNVSN